jgi:hypothetical protein
MAAITAKSQPFRHLRAQMAGRIHRLFKKEVIPIATQSAP